MFLEFHAPNASWRSGVNPQERNPVGVLCSVAEYIFLQIIALLLVRSWWAVHCNLHELYKAREADRVRSEDHQSQRRLMAVMFHELRACAGLDPRT